MARKRRYRVTSQYGITNYGALDMSVQAFPNLNKAFQFMRQQLKEYPGVRLMLEGPF